MVLAEIWDERRLRKARAEVHRLWEEWLQRRMDAEAKGDPFGEPPPSQASERR